MIDKFKVFLEANRIKWEESSDSDELDFRFDDLNILFISPKDDPLYFRIAVPNVYQITEDDKIKVFEKVNELNAYFKIAKGIFYDDMLWIVTEQYALTDLRINSLFNQCLRILGGYVERLRREVDND